MIRIVLCRSRREIPNEYLVAEIGFDTAENEPCKAWPLSVCRSSRLDLPGGFVARQGGLPPWRNARPCVKKKEEKERNRKKIVQVEGAETARGATGR